MPPEETPAFALSVPLRRAARAEFLVAGFVRERRYRPCILAGTGQKVHSRIGRHSAAYSQTPKGDRVTHSLLSRHVAIAGAVVILGLPSALAAQPPTPQEILHATTAGSYLAARHAGTERDSATAAAYYLNVLKADPRNVDLLGRTFLSVLTDGDIDEAGKLADRLIQVDRPTASRAWSSACGRSSRSSTRSPARVSRNRCAAR